MAARAQIRQDRRRELVLPQRETRAITRHHARLAGALLLATFVVAACTKSRPPDLTVLASSPEQITYEVMVESPLFSKTRAASPAEVIAAAEAFCAQYKRKALFVRTIQRATNMQNVTYDCVAPS